MTVNKQMVNLGYMTDSQGRLVPEENVSDQDKLRDQVARGLADRAIELNRQLRQFKHEALKDIADLVAITADRYGVQIGGEKGNVTVSTYDGRYKIQRVYAERVGLTEEVLAAKELIDKCLIKWSEGANANIHAVIDHAFRSDRNGQLKTAAILDLTRMKIDDDDWVDAMAALRDSMIATGTAVYVRVYVRTGADSWRPIPLDIAAVSAEPLPADGLGVTHGN